MTNAKEYLKNGNAKFDLKKYEEAIEDYDEAIKLDPNAEIYHNRGKAKFELKQYEEAIVDFNRAIAIAIAFNIPCAKTFNIRASARAELIFAQIEEFLKDYKEAIELDVNNKERYNDHIDDFINRLKYYMDKNIWTKNNIKTKANQ